MVGAVALGGLSSCALDGNGKRSGSSHRILSGPNRILKEVDGCRPTRFVKKYRVDSSGSNNAFKTFKECYAAVLADKQKALGTSGVPSAQSNPWDWREIEVAPGDYHECIVGLPNHTAIVGLGQHPEDVHIWWDGPDNTFTSTGGSCYVENVHLDSQSKYADAHAMRDAGSGGDVGLAELQRRTVIFKHVRFTSLVDAPLTKCSNDMAPRAGASLSFIGCVFDAPGQPQSVNLVTNSGPGSEPAQFHFINCNVVSSHTQHPDPALREIETVPAVPVGIVDFGRGRAEKVLWMNGSWDVGTSFGAQGLIVLPMEGDPTMVGQTAKPATQTYVINAGAVKGLKTLLIKDGALPVKNFVPDDFHVPQGCVSPAESRFFGNPPTVREKLIAPSFTAKSDTDLKVKIGDFFWVPLKLDKDAVSAVSVEVEGMADGEFFAVATLDAKGIPNLDGNAMAASSGPSAGGRAPLSRRWFYPGQGQVWVGILFNADRAVRAGEIEGNGGLRGKKGGSPIVDPRSCEKTLAVPRVSLVSGRPATMEA